MHWNRKRTFVLIGSSLIFTGAIFLYFDALPMVFYPQNYENPSQLQAYNNAITSISKPVTRTYSIDYPTMVTIFNNTYNGLGNVQITITFDQNTVYVGDNVGCEIQVTMNPVYDQLKNNLVPHLHDVSTIDIIGVNDQEDIGKEYNTSINVTDEIRNHLQTSIQIIPQVGQVSLIRTSIPLSREGDMLLHVFVIPKTNSGIPNKLDTDPIFTIHPTTDKLQVVSATNSLNQSFTEIEIIGLSWVAVFIGLILVGSDVLLRIYLEPYGDDMKNQNLITQKTKSDSENFEGFPPKII